MGGVAPSPVHAPPRADRHNAALSAAHRRVEELEQRLADILQPILEQAGARAAAKFTRTATHHLTAAMLREADRQALGRIRPGEHFGFRLRPFTLTASAPTRMSAMVCLKPRPDEAVALALPGGETAESLHVTLVFLGEVEGDLRPVVEALKAVAASHAPLEGVIGGVGRFQPPGVAILLPDVPGLVELRVAVTEALVAADVPYGREHGYEAHISVDAEPDPETLDEALTRTAQQPVHFDSILIVQGDETVFELPLVGVPPLTASGVCSYCNGVGGLGQSGEVCRDGEPPTMACICTLTAAGGEHVGWTPPAPDELIDIDQLVSTLRTKTDPVRTALVKTAMTPTLKDAGHVFDVTNPLTAKVLAQSGSQIKNIANTTRLNVMRIISRAYNDGLSIPDTAKAIRAGMASASAYRARMIARTELAGAANGGSLAAAQIADRALGIGLYKQWLTAPGAPHPRHEDYEGLDGQTVGLEDPFDVGGDSLQFPGDPDGSPEETINCRCALSYTETAPDGSPAAAAETAPGGGVTDEGVSESGDTALQDVMPLTPPPGDTVSVNSAPFVPPEFVARITENGLDLPLNQIQPTTTVGKEVFAKAPTTEGLFKPGGAYMPDGSYKGGHWTPEREQIHQDIVAAHFQGRTPPTTGEKKTAVFTAGGGASGKGGTLIEIGDRSFPLSDLEDDAARLGTGAAHDKLVAEGDEWAIRGEAKYPDVILMNPDIVKTMLPEYKSLRKAGDLYAASGVHEESSEVSKVIADIAQKQGYNVVVDTTGSSGTFLGKLEQAAKDGYQVKVRMTSIPTNIAIVRAMERGARSGRYVAIQALKKGHAGASKQLALWKESKAVSDWQLWDNSVLGKDRVLVASGKDGVVTIKDQEKWDQILAKADETSTAPGAAVEKTATAVEPAVGPASASLVQTVTLGRAAGGPEVRDALAAIDKVHTLPPLRTDPVPVTSNPELRAENGARLVSHSEGAAGVIPDRIEINPMGTHIELDLAHEIGHEIDYSLLQQDRVAVIEAAHATDAWKSLEKIDTAHGEYLRRDREVFARAYAQWIAERSGNEAMLRALDNYAEDAKFGVANQQWTREDFAPVAAEFDKLFGDRGLLLVTPPAAPVTTAEAASAKLATATAAEPSVTPALSSIANELGGKMEGLDFRIKGQASMERKINADIAEAAQDGVTMTPEEAAGRINDALRYTMVFPDADYTAGVTQALQRLQANGFQQIKLKNFWGNPDYQGINGIFEKNGQRIELQFHTPMSLKVKEDQLHPLFEKYRVSTDPSESGKLWVAMEKASANVPQPVGVQALGTLERHEPPAGLVTEPPHPDVATLVPGPSIDTLNDVDKFQQTQFDDWAAHYPVGELGDTVQEIRDGYTARLDDVLAEATKDADVKIRLKSDVLGKLADDGRFKSQFESERSGGLLDPEWRAKAERTMFGYPTTLDPKLRPIYGYLGGSTAEGGVIKTYGDHVVVLKDAARDRTTFTLTDSLNGGGHREFSPVPLVNPENASRAYPTNRWNGIGDPLKIGPDLKELSETYAEAQIHGGVSLDDIESITINRYAFENDALDIEDTLKYYDREVDKWEEALAEGPTPGGRSIEDTQDRLAAARLGQTEMKEALAYAEAHTIEKLTQAFEARGIKVIVDDD